jgi:hypothetical protein
MQDSQRRYELLLEGDDGTICLKIFRCVRMKFPSLVPLRKVEPQHRTAQEISNVLLYAVMKIL